MIYFCFLKRLLSLDYIIIEYCFTLFQNPDFHNEDTRDQKLTITIVT